MTIYTFLLLLGCFIGLPWAMVKIIQDHHAWVLGLVYGFFLMIVILPLGNAITRRDVGYESVDSKNIIIERGDFSCTFHIKDSTGTVIHTLRIDKAIHLDSFNRNEYSIGHMKRYNIWMGYYTESIPQFTPNGEGIEK